METTPEFVIMRNPDTGDWSLIQLTIYGAFAEKQDAEEYRAKLESKTEETVDTL